METEKLIRECCRRSITAQKYFFDKYASAMYLLCRRYMRNNESAEEVMMNGFYHCFTALEQFRFTNEAAFMAWLKRIFINECLQVLRKRNDLVVVSDEEAANITTNETALDELSAEEIFLLITRLPQGYKTVFNLFVIEGYSHKEIAALLNVTEGTSKSQLSKARLVLQQMITVNNNHYHAATK
jgi:RNA polymerase sigma factor (sigma-70 family)